MTFEVDHPETCITCGDVAVSLEVIELDGADALCCAADGGTERVAIDFVAPVAVGDRVLVHARVAIERLSPIIDARDGAPAKKRSAPAYVAGERGARH